MKIVWYTKLDSGRRIMVVRMVWDHVDRVRFSAARPIVVSFYLFKIKTAR